MLTGGDNSMILLRFLSIIVLALPVMANGHESPVDCLAYLSAEWVFEKKTGETPDHQKIEVALSKLPVGDKNHPWKNWLHAWDRVDWAQDYQRRLDTEDRRQSLLGTSVPNVMIKRSTASDRFRKALDQAGAAEKELDGWLETHGMSAEIAKFFRAFVLSYRKKHDVHSYDAPFLVLRVAVHERETMCPP